MELLACTNELVFKSLYGRIRIRRNSNLAQHILQISNEVDSDAEFVYLNNENDFMGQRASAVVNMCVYISHGRSASVVDLQMADPYKQFSSSLCAGLNDCNSRFRSILGPRDLYDQGDMYHQHSSPIGPTASLLGIPKQAVQPVINKGPKKRAIPRKSSPQTPVPVKP